MNNTPIRFAGLDWESPVPGMRQKKVVHNGTSIRIVEFTADFTEEDWCAGSHAGYVIEGSLEIEYQSGFVHYEKGDGIYISQSMPHKAHVQMGGRALVFLIEHPGF